MCIPTSAHAQVFSTPKYCFFTTCLIFYVARRKWIGLKKIVFFVMIVVLRLQNTTDSKIEIETFGNHRISLKTVPLEISENKQVQPHNAMSLLLPIHTLPCLVCLLPPSYVRLPHLRPRPFPLQPALCELHFSFCLLHHSPHPDTRPAPPSLASCRLDHILIVRLPSLHRADCTYTCKTGNMI